MTRRKTFIIVFCSIIAALIIYDVPFKIYKSITETVDTNTYTVEIAPNGNTSSTISPLVDDDKHQYLVRTTNKEAFWTSILHT